MADVSARHRRGLLERGLADASAWLIDTRRDTRVTRAAVVLAVAGGR